MKEYVSSVSPKGQITIPAEVRRQLGVKPKDKVAMQVEGETLRVTPAPFTLESAYGSVTPTKQPEDFEEVTQHAKTEHVEGVLRQLATE